MSRSHHHNFDLNAVTGLSENEAAERLRRDGPNELPTAKKRGVLAIGAGVVREPMFLLLLVCGAIYFFLGEAQEALMLFICGLHRRDHSLSERKRNALDASFCPAAPVIRGGQAGRRPRGRAR